MEKASPHQTPKMSPNEQERARVIGLACKKQLLQREAAEQLDLSVRQIKRLARRYRERGPEGLVSGHRGKASNNRLPEAVRRKALALAAERYSGLGPTAAHERLTQEHGLRLSTETLRQWMMEAGLWQGRRPARTHRRRCGRLGELAQVSGSPGDWFEGRGPPCSLLTFIDDATVRLMAMRFVPEESVLDYLALLCEYVRRHGRPQALYTDRRDMLRITRKGMKECETQFGRVLRLLEMGIAYAGTAQARKRMACFSQARQDRLIEAMRLHGVSGPQAANAFLPAYMDECNQNFAEPPHESRDAHRPIAHNRRELEVVFSLQYEKRPDRNLEFRHRGRIYRIRGKRGRHALEGRTVVLCEGLDGKIQVFRREAEFLWEHELEAEVQEEDHKREIKKRDRKSPMGG